MRTSSGTILAMRRTNRNAESSVPIAAIASLVSRNSGGSSQRADADHGVNRKCNNPAGDLDCDQALGAAGPLAEQQPGIDDRRRRAAYDA
jgi:hypothetical protein